MLVNQIATILNDLNAAMVGADTTFAEDLSNIVDAGKTVLDFTSDANGANFDNYIKGIIDRVGKVTFVDRVYVSQAPNLLKNSWEYGSILMKVRTELMDATSNSSWQLGDIPNGAGAGYDWEQGTDPQVQIIPSRLDPFVLSKPTANAKFYNKRVTYEVKLTIAREQLKEAFRSESEMNRFTLSAEESS